MRYFDSHTHVNFSAFKDDRKEVIERALKNGVWMVNIGTQKDTSRRAVEIANEYKEGIYAAVGLHPIHTSKSFHDIQELEESNSGIIPRESLPAGRQVRFSQRQSAVEFMSRAEEFDYDYYKKLALDPKVVAVGECGLDYYRVEPSANRETQIDKEKSLDDARDKQKKVFEAQIELSKEIKKSLMVHSRDAFSDTLEILKSNKAEGGIAHSFVRTVEEARELLNLGFYFTFAGNITFKPRVDKPAADEVIEFIPMDRILSETDAPYLAPVPYRGKRNEPLYVTEVVKKLAEIKGVSTEEMAARTFENAKRVFRIQLAR